MSDTPEMEPGRELDAWLVVNILGWRRGDSKRGEMPWVSPEGQKVSVPPLSTTWEGMGVLIEGTREVFDVQLRSRRKFGDYFATVEEVSGRRRGEFPAPTGPGAVALAFYAALRRDKGMEKPEQKVGHWFNLRHEDDSLVLDPKTGWPMQGWCDDPECPTNKALLKRTAGESR